MVQRHKDRTKALMMKTYRTVTYRNIRLRIPMASSLNQEVLNQDVIEANTKGYDMQSDVFIKPTDYFQLKSKIYLKLLKNLYRLSEHGNS